MGLYAKIALRTLCASSGQGGDEINNSSSSRVLLVPPTKNPANASPKPNRDNPSEDEPSVMPSVRNDSSGSTIPPNLRSHCSSDPAQEGGYLAEEEEEEEVPSNSNKKKKKKQKQTRTSTDRLIESVELPRPKKLSLVRRSIQPQTSSSFSTTSTIFRRKPKMFRHPPQKGTLGKTTIQTNEPRLAVSTSTSDHKENNRNGSNQASRSESSIIFHPKPPPTKRRRTSTSCLLEDGEESKRRSKTKKKRKKLAVRRSIRMKEQEKKHQSTTPVADRSVERTYETQSSSSSSVKNAIFLAAIQAAKDFMSSEEGSCYQAEDGEVVVLV